ncbi:sporulation protein YunB [Desulfohalotomaculum tongense]|uniref:sporulation protein YunB n=1 Tax=Desulforadius tongensis TaxID=1216062 RepID=UPI0019591A7F|nr:sporulation protein YunB [Desulforadius tongensis]MBM7855105.1 sporulation protein YunB [Desulforadius tongensis]
MFKRRRRISGTTFFIVLLIVSVGLIYWYVDKNLRPSIIAIAESRANLMVNDVVSEAVQQKVAEENVCYEDLINLHKDSSGKIVMMQANTIRINQLATDITLEVDKALRQIEHENIEISLGQTMGSHFLADFGPRINVSILPVGSVNVLVSDKFDSTGINQTRHQITLDLKTRVAIAVPFYQRDINVHTVVPLTESIIVGDVPETWVSIPGGLLGGGSLSETMLEK